MTTEHFKIFALFSTDTDECTIYANICDHICNNTVGSFVCYCEPNFVLGSDGRSCLGIMHTYLSLEYIDEWNIHQ